MSIGMVAPAIALLRAEGRDVHPVLAAGGVSGEALADPAHRVTIQAATRVWQAALREVPDPHFGLRAALLIENGDVDLLSCLARSCATLEEALGCFERFGRLLDETLTCSLRRERGGCFFSLGKRSVHYLPAVAEYAALRLVLLGRSLLGNEHGLLEVHFTHQSPRDLRFHRDVFRATLRFERPEVGLLLEPSMLALPVASADPVLKAVLVGSAERLIDAVKPTITASQRVRDVLIELLPSGVPSRARVARRLGVSERTLARFLEAEDTHYTSLIDELRIELAMRHLQDGRLAVGAIAAELGFRDQSAFTKFFKRRAGVPPLEYRRRYRFRA